MTTSNDLVQQINDAKKRLLSAERDLRKPRGHIVLGPMDVETPWSEDGRRVVRERELIDNLTKELGSQVLREKG